MGLQCTLCHAHLKALVLIQKSKLKIEVEGNITFQHLLSGSFCTELVHGLCSTFDKINVQLCDATTHNPSLFPTHNILMSSADAVRLFGVVIDRFYHRLSVKSPVKPSDMSGQTSVCRRNMEGSDRKVCDNTNLFSISLGTSCVVFWINCNYKAPYLNNFKEHYS